jgi:hypothetical protein
MLPPVALGRTACVEARSLLPYVTDTNQAVYKPEYQT